MNNAPRKSNSITKNELIIVGLAVVFFIAGFWLAATTDNANLFTFLLLTFFIALFGAIAYSVVRSTRERKRDRQTLSEEEYRKKYHNNFFSHIFDWRISDEEIAEDIEKGLGSYRKLAAWLIVFSSILGVLLGSFFDYSYSDIIWSAIIYLFLAFFIYKGHRWAIIIAMIIWTLDKGSQLAIAVNNSGSAILSPIIWWGIYMGVFWKALKVENVRRKNELVTPQMEHAHADKTKQSRKFSSPTKIWLALFGLLIMGSFFYWYQIRPMQSRTTCAQEVKDLAQKQSISVETARAHYDICMHEHGY